MELIYLIFKGTIRFYYFLDDMKFGKMVHPTDLWCKFGWFRERENSVFVCMKFFRIKKKNRNWKAFDKKNPRFKYFSHSLYRKKLCFYLEMNYLWFYHEFDVKYRNAIHTINILEEYNYGPQIIWSEWSVDVPKQMKIKIASH